MNPILFSQSFKTFVTKKILPYKTFFLLCIIILLAVPPRIAHLTQNPPLIVDEPAYLRDINTLIREGGFHPAAFQWDPSQAALVYYPTIILIILGVRDQVFALRIVSVIYSILALIPLYFLLKKFTNDSIACCFTLLFSYSYYYLQFSRVGWGVMYSLTFALYALWTLWNALEKRSYLWTILSGLCTALILYTYRSGQVYCGACILLFLSYIFSSKKYIKKYCLLFLLYSITVSVISLPWFIQIATHWDFYNLRLHAVSVPAHGSYHGEYSQQGIFTYQVVTSVEAWIFLQGIQGGGIEDQRYLPQVFAPVDICIAVFFWIGCIVGFWNIRKTALLYIILALGIYFGQIQTVDPPNGARGLILLPIMYLFAAYGYKTVFWKPGIKRYALPILIILTGTFMLYDLSYYWYWMSWIRV